MDPIEGEFICRKCQTPLSITRIVVSKKGYAIFEVHCQKKHSGKRRFNMAQQNEWMPTVIKHLYMCPRCSSNLTDMRQKTDSDKTVLLLNCPTHRKIKKVVSTSFWYAMDALRKQLSARPAYSSPYGQQYPPGSYPPYQQSGFQQPPPPGQYGTPPPIQYGQQPPRQQPPTQPGQYPPSTAPPPETVSPPQFEVTPPSQPPAPASSPSTIDHPPSGDSTGAGEICPACGEPISPGAQFCTNCGTELG